MKEIYLPIMAQLRTIEGMENADIDLFNNQYNDGKDKNEDEPIPAKAVYIELLPIQWQEVSSGVQTGTVFMRLHVVHQSFAETKNADKLSSQEQADAFAYSDLSKTVMANMQNFTFDGASPINRTSFTEDTQHDSQRVSLLDFTFEYEDTTGNPQASWPTTSPALKVLKNNTLPLKFHKLAK